MRILPLGLVLLGACSLTSRSSHNLQPEIMAPPEAWQGIRRVAVLPPDNWTVTIGPEYVAWYRAVIHELLREKGYAVTPLVDVNRFMLRNKFSLAGEVGIYPMPELAQELNADALLFWDITGEGYNFNLVKADGTRLWGTGEVHLSLLYNAIPRAHYAPSDFQLSLALAEILLPLPRRP